MVDDKLILVGGVTTSSSHTPGIVILNLESLTWNSFTLPVGFCLSWGRADLFGPDAPRSRKVEGVARKLLGVILSGAPPCADLGGSSKYSREALEDRCGEGFRVNSR